MIEPRGCRGTAATLAALVALAGSPAAAQELPPVPALDTVTVTAGAAYGAGGLHRWLLGRGYRDLWTTPIRVPVLDLARFAGGVRAVDEGGGEQTRSLRLENGSGLQYVVRSVDKDPSAILPEDIRAPSPGQRAVRDQISASYPAGALAAARLVEAIGLPHPEPVLVVLPDDPRLGEWREEYAGMLGMLEQYPDEREGDRPGFVGASKIVGSDELFERLNESPAHRADATSFLRARLLDFVMNDWDRHHDQWRWVGTTQGEDSVWVPVPRDRDQAFAGFGGLLLGVARMGVPRLVPYDAVPSLPGLTFNSLAIDRRLLAGVERDEFDEAARFVQSRLTDEVIAEALARLPAEYREQSADTLTALLRTRRDALPSIATAFYDMLADYVDVHATDEADQATIERHDDGTVTVRLAAARDDEDDGEGGGDDDAPAYFERRFLPDETSEVRVYLHGGDDAAIVRGEAKQSVTVRVAGGRGVNEYTDSSRVGGRSEPTRFYDTDGAALVTYGPDTLPRQVIDRRPWVQTPARATPEPPPPDYGSSFGPGGSVAYLSGYGIIMSAGVSLTQYGFRHAPYARRYALVVEHATGPGRWRVAGEAEFRREESDLAVAVSAAASGLEVVRFHGFGNDTELLAGGEDAGFYDARHRQYGASVALRFPIGTRTRAEVGPFLRYATTRTREGTLLGTSMPYGAGDFGYVGIGAEFEWDRSGGVGIERRGFVLGGEGAFAPAGWDADDAFGHLGGVATLHLPFRAGLRGSVALRGGAKRSWGAFPWFAAAFLGGPETVRGLAPQRFAGQAAAWSSAELRLRLARITLLFPSDIGVLGLVDAGRVWTPGEESDEWHTSGGGGVFVSLLGSSGTAALVFADAGEGTRTYLTLGLPF